MKVLAAGLHFGEGPRWRDDRLWLSDFYDRAVLTVDMAGNVTPMLDVARQPSGLGWLPDGRLLVVSMLDRRVLRMEAEGPVVHADLSEVAEFHCNDMVVDDLGRAWVGNFGFDLDASFAERGVAATMADHPTATLTRVDPDGSVHVAARGMHFPNGMVVADGGATLVVAETLAARLVAFPIASNGELGNSRVWAELPRATPDGIALDPEGRVWVADPAGRRCVLVREGGAIQAEVGTDDPCYACALDPQTSTLFMLTARSSAARVASSERTGRVLTTPV